MKNVLDARVSCLTRSAMHEAQAAAGYDDAPALDERSAAAAQGKNLQRAIQFDRKNPKRKQYRSDMLL